MGCSPASLRPIYKVSSQIQNKMNNKFKNTRIVTFTEDYLSGPQKAQVEKGKAVAPIYKKDSVHAIHKDTVKQLQEKGAKMKVKEFDHAAYVSKSKKQKAENQKK